MFLILRIEKKRKKRKGKRGEERKGEERKEKNKKENKKDIHTLKHIQVGVFFHFATKILSRAMNKCRLYYLTATSICNHF